MALFLFLTENKQVDLMFIILYFFLGISYLKLVAPFIVFLLYTNPPLVKKMDFSIFLLYFHPLCYFEELDLKSVLETTKMSPSNLMKSLSSICNGINTQ